MLLATNCLTLQADLMESVGSTEEQRFTPRKGRRFMPWSLLSLGCLATIKTNRQDKNEQPKGG